MKEQSICAKLERTPNVDLMRQAVKITNREGIEVGFRFCKTSDNKFAPTKICMGDHCSLTLDRCPGKTVGSFHTHPPRSQILDNPRRYGLNTKTERDVARTKYPLFSHEDIIGDFKDNSGFSCIGQDDTIKCLHLHLFNKKEQNELRRYLWDIGAGQINRDYTEVAYVNEHLDYQGKACRIKI